jgi:hypothetical protein
MVRRKRSLEITGAAIVLALWAGQMSSKAFAQLDSNDPWPKFGHDEQNSCYSRARGPHAPELRWWATLGDTATQHIGGSAIARINGTNYAIVGTASPVSGGLPVVKIFRIDVDDPSHNPTTAATPIQTIVLPAADDVVNSTPLVLPNRWVVIQTNRRLIAYDLSVLPAAPVLKWRSVGFASEGASPTFGRVNRLPGNLATMLFAQGHILGTNNIQWTVLASLDPTIASATDRSFAWTPQELRPYTFGPTLNCPAIGTLHPNDSLYPVDGVRLVYCATIGNSNDGYDHIFNVFADGAAHGGHPTRLAGSFQMSVIGGVNTGTFGSPSVHLPDAPADVVDRVVVAADNSHTYGIKNRSDFTGPSLQRWVRLPAFLGNSFSVTPVLTPRADILARNEGAAIIHDGDVDDSSFDLGGAVTVTPPNVDGKQAGDLRRYYMSTYINGDPPDNRRVRSVMNRAHPQHP